MKFQRGDRVQHTIENIVGIITNIKERGVAGSSTTYREWIEITCDNGMIIKVTPEVLSKFFVPESQDA
tara:strand:+ start:115 stop:318 length:204 start_codon:yes stop_codon:yes gene_type:complete